MWPFKPRALDAITMECLISLADEPERWRLDLFSSGALGRVWRTQLDRDDGLKVSVRESAHAPWPTYAASVYAPGGGAYEASGADLRALRNAVRTWVDTRGARETDRVRAFLTRAR